MVDTHDMTKHDANAKLTTQKAFSLACALLSSTAMSLRVMGSSAGNHRSSLADTTTTASPRTPAPPVTRQMRAVRAPRFTNGANCAFTKDVVRYGDVP